MSLKNKMREIRQLKADVKALGARSGDDGPCHCPYPGAGTILWPDGSILEHGPCQRCGRPRRTVRVVYGESLEEEKAKP